MFKVVLIRGPLESKIWEHETKQAALRRAEALEGLHSANGTHQKCRVVESEDHHTFTLDASEYYGG